MVLSLGGGLGLGLGAECPGLYLGLIYAATLVEEQDREILGPTVISLFFIGFRDSLRNTISLGSSIGSCHGGLTHRVSG